MSETYRTVDCEFVLREVMRFDETAKTRVKEYRLSVFWGRDNYNSQAKSPAEAMIELGQFWLDRDERGGAK